MTNAIGLFRQFNGLLDRVAWDIPALALRVFPAAIFFASGRTKMDGWQIADSTWFLFEHEYALPLIPAPVAAVAATVAEHVLPILLILGIATRLSALGLLGMTAVIQIFVYPEAWQTHGLWAACLLAVAARGPGRLSVDHLAGLDGPPAAHDATQLARGRGERG